MMNAKKDVKTILLKIKHKIIKNEQEKNTHWIGILRIRHLTKENTKKDVLGLLL